MPFSCLPYQPDQQQRLLAAWQDWLPQGHRAYYISNGVNSLNLSAFHNRYGSGGSRNEPPNGSIKAVLGFRQMSMRGLDKCKAEF